MHISTTNNDGMIRASFISDPAMRPAVYRRASLHTLRGIACAAAFGQASSALAQNTTDTSSIPSPHAETIKARAAARPEVQNLPHAGVVGQPRRIAPSQNKAPSGRQGPWGEFDRGTGESAGFGPVGRYGVAPWAEDWSYLADPSPKLRDDPFDPLKFIALNSSRTIWLSLSGETRLRNWYEEEPNLGSKGHPGSGRFGVRNLYGADLHLGSHVRVFGQLINADAAGWNAYGYNDTYRKRLDLQQAFVEFRENLLGAKTGFMFGRQQFLDAPSYILYNRETPNVPLAWNGFRTYAIWPRIRIDAYDFVGTNIAPSQMFHDTEDWTTRLYGFDATMVVPTLRVPGGDLHSYLDLFYIGFKLGGSTAAIVAGNGTASGNTTRDDYGFRWYGSAKDLEFSVGGLYQGGTFNAAKTNVARTVAAYAFNATVGYRHPESFLHPFVGVQADLYSGGDTRNKTGDVGTYIAPFNPQTNYLDTTTYIAPSNLISLSPIVRVTPVGFASLQFKCPFFWRDSTNDSIYSSSSAYSYPRFSGGYVGVVPQASLTLQLNRHLSWTQYGARFITSNSLHAAGARSGSYYQSNFVFRF
jgi:hypothetical protein